ncbi:MAG: hypothetical protein HZC23_02005 [Rhodocyclales bacterium]|nr:hypothetical protein [Rhodocyclales bacterium]
MKSSLRLAVAALAAAFAMSLPALAAESPRPGAVQEGGRPPMDDAQRKEMQQKMKERVLDHIDAKIKILQSTQSCIRAASDVESMAVCHAQERKQMKDIRDKERSEIRERNAQRGERQGPPPGSGPR